MGSWWETPPDANSLRILIATDNHLGIFERDPIRRDDSFLVMEEILQNAIAKHVDFLLLGGDLFEANKPSRETLFRTMNLFRQYCLGDRPIEFVVENDCSGMFSNSEGLNFLSDTVNISLPVFIIHGNHDDPTGEMCVGALDLLSSSQLVNYFGKVPDPDSIQCKPILISKGRAKLALYGFGYIRDERLVHTFENRRVRFFRPEAEKDSWYNLLTIHQNRNQFRTPHANIKADYIPKFIDLVVWGHEHESRTYPERVAHNDRTFISQPGSSVVTSMSPDETAPKEILLLEITSSEDSSPQRRWETIRLTNQRPVLLRDINLCDSNLDPRTTSSEKLIDFLTDEIEDLLFSCRLEDGFCMQYPHLRLPVVRIRVNTSGGFSSVNPHRIGARFINRIANPNSVVVFQAAKKKPPRAGGKYLEPDNSDSGLAFESEHFSVNDIIHDRLVERGQSLLVMDERNMAISLDNYVGKEDDKIFHHNLEKIISSSISSIENLMKEKVPEETVVLADDVLKAVRLRSPFPLRY